MQIEKQIQRYIGKSKKILEIDKLDGGISSENYKVSLQNKKTNNSKEENVVVTLFKEKGDWWKLDKEYYLRELIGIDPEIYLPLLIDAGDDVLENGKSIRFLIREFIQGQDLDKYIVNKESEELIDWETMNRKLGRLFTSLHKHRVPFTGLIRSSEVGHITAPSWEEYISTQLSQEFDAIMAFPQDQKIGNIPLSQLQFTIDKLSKKLNSFIFNDENSVPLAHGDARMGNVIGEEKNGQFSVKSLIDFEWALGGDPEIDLAFLENWLFFTNYQKKFYEHKKFFLEEYLKENKLSENYSEKRVIYHSLRSLSFLNAMLRNPDLKTFSQDEIVNGHISKHFHIISELSRGLDLESIGIPDITK